VGWSAQVRPARSGPKRSSCERGAASPALLAAFHVNRCDMQSRAIDKPDLPVLVLPNCSCHSLKSREFGIWFPIEKALAVSV
jgi:hypothetical protein